MFITTSKIFYVFISRNAWFLLKNKKTRLRVKEVKSKTLKYVSQEIKVPFSFRKPESRKKREREKKNNPYFYPSIIFLFDIAV